MENYDDILIYRIDALQDAVERNETVRTIVVVYNYITAVEADGLIGYLYGYSGDYASQLIAALEEIGAATSKEIVKGVLAFFPACTPAEDVEERSSQIGPIILETGSEDPWKDLNKAFIDNLPELEIQFSAYVNKYRALITSYSEDKAQKLMIARAMKKMKR